jgi:hypothetical protein
MRNIRSYLVLALSLALSGGNACAETLVVDSVHTNANLARPGNGVTMDSVLATYGEPAHRAGPVGEPPISTWDYTSFVVYFENDRVIHSVVPHH